MELVQLIIDRADTAVDLHHREQDAALGTAFLSLLVYPLGDVLQDRVATAAVCGAKLMSVAGVWPEAKLSGLAAQCDALNYERRPTFPRFLEDPGVGFWRQPDHGK